MKKKPEPKSDRREMVDQYGNVFMVADELSRGGQGVVFRTRDADIAIKQPIDSATGFVFEGPEKTAQFAETVENLRLLPIPESIPVTMPLSTLEKAPGYAMKLLSGMRPVSSFEPTGDDRKKLLEEPPPAWLANVSSADLKTDLMHFGRTGGLRRRLAVLRKTAAILARLHSAGIVYADISPNNAFAGEGPDPEVWIIDPDNMRLESSRGSSVYTPGYGAPEVVTGRDSARPRTDCWAFAVLAFRMLALAHPFIGKKVLEPDSDGDWADEPQQASPGAGSPDDRAFAGEFPFIDDEDDDSNAFTGGLPRSLVLTDGLRRLFQETFGAGRLSPWRRPPMLLWARELAWAFDHAIDCPGCGMGYYADDNKSCPWCDRPRPSCAILGTSRWQVIRPWNPDAQIELPNRLFFPFSVSSGDRECTAVQFDPATRKVRTASGYEDLPEQVSATIWDGAI